MTTVALLFGGISPERQISIISGKACSRALKELGFTVVEVDVTSSDPEYIKEQLTPRPDLVFNSLHGTFGEDGGIQNILNVLKIPYTHSGAASSRLCMDKYATLKMYSKHNIPRLEHWYGDARALCESDIPFKRPFVFKPANGGSSIGLHIIKENTLFPDLTQWQFGKILVEPYIPGLELTVCVLEGEPLCVTELIPTSGVYTYAEKYTDTLTKHVCPANIDAKVQQKLLHYAQKAHKILGCRGISRTDFRFDPATNTIATLETNTQPGMTKHSLSPEQASLRGISFTELVHTLVKLARTDNG